MNKPIMLGALWLASGAVFAATDASTSAIQAASHAATAAQQRPLDNEARFGRFDANADGALQRAEVAEDSELKTRFPALDTNGDGKLSRPEFDARNSDTRGGSR